MPDHFLLDGEMYHRDAIRWLKLDGGPDGCGCWGEILLDGWDKPRAIGDGSYKGSLGHVPHLVAGSLNNPDYGFTVLKSIMREVMPEYWKKRQKEG